MFAKPIAAISIILLSATVLTAEANARCGGGHGGFRAGPSFSLIKRQQSIAAARQRQQAIAAAKARQQKAALAAAASKKAEAAKVAKAEAAKQDDAPAAKVAETTTTDTSSTTTKVAAAETTCKKFVPAIGATVDVACEQKN
jgi:hypothetical protein